MKGDQQPLSSRLRRLEARLREHRGWRVPFGDHFRSASVAAIVRPVDDDLSLLLIRRPERERDRWSGNLAFPGGLSTPDDASLTATATREAREEVGLELDAPIGRLSDLVTAEPGRPRPMRVVPLVFVVRRGVRLEPDPGEVADAFWVPMRVIASAPHRRVWKRIGPFPVAIRGVDVNHRLLWGLTFAMVEELLRLAR